MCKIVLRLCKQKEQTVITYVETLFNYWNKTSDAADPVAYISVYFICGLSLLMILYFQ